MVRDDEADEGADRDGDNARRHHQALDDILSETDDQSELHGENELGTLVSLVIPQPLEAEETGESEGDAETDVAAGPDEVDR